MTDAATSAPRCILVVDDDPDIAFVIGNVLERDGYAVVIASDGSEALARLREGPTPCLVLLDLMMPGMSGWEFREIQLRDPTLSSIPVIVMSGANQLEQKTASLRLAGIVRKPIERDDLLALARRHCIECSRG